MKHKIIITIEETYTPRDDEEADRYRGAICQAVWAVARAAKFKIVQLMEEDVSVEIEIDGSPEWPTTEAEFISAIGGMPHTSPAPGAERGGDTECLHTL